MTDEQKLELKNVYKGLKSSRDKESKKLYTELFNTINFIKIPSNCFIETVTVCRNYYTKGKYEFCNFGVKPINELPISVICYLITKDDEYLEIGHYKKIKYKGYTYIYTSMYGYCVNKIFFEGDISKIFTV